MRGDETPEMIFIKFGIPINIHDVITPAKFGGDRSRGGSQISQFPIGLSGRPLCE